MMQLRLAATIFLLLVPLAGAETNMPTSAFNDAPIEATADSLEYARGGSILKATGHVVITSGADRLSADRATVKLDSREAWATDHVTLTQSNNVWTGDRLYCNFATGVVRGEGAKSEVTVAPFTGFVRGRCSKVGETVTGSDATMTTCNLPNHNWHYYLTASQATMVKNESIAVRHVIFYLAGIPVLYVPYWGKSSSGDGFGCTPGYASDMGAYVRTYYRYHINESLRGTTRVDYRTKRGFGLGQDLDWTGTNSLWAGGLSVYNARDKWPSGDRPAAVPPQVLEEDRYRVLLFHDQVLDNRLRLLTRLQYLSDQYLLSDFFRAEYRLEPQPDNYVSLNYRGDNFSAGISVRPRLNDFFGAVARIPEAQLDFPLQQLGASPFDYESQSTAGYLEKLWPAGNTNAEYSAFRLDTRHEVSVTRKVGFLNVVPRIAARGTYYSATRPSDGSEEGGAGMRTMLEAGTQVSFKMFKIYRDAETNGGLRHVVEPYANYTFIPEPNLVPGRLFNFDSIDTLDKQNVLRLGVRNALQTKRAGLPYDLLDLDVWSDGNLSPTGSVSMFELVNMNATLRPLTNVTVDCDGKFPLSGGGPEQVNIHLVYGASTMISTDLEYRYRRDTSSLIAGTLTYNPSEHWTYTYGARYEMEGSRLEEHNLWIQRNYDCMCVALGFNQIPGYALSGGTFHENEFQVMFKIWLKAFPEIGAVVN